MRSDRWPLLLGASVVLAACGLDARGGSALDAAGGTSPGGSVDGGAPATIGGAGQGGAITSGAAAGQPSSAGNGGSPMTNGGAAGEATMVGGAGASGSPANGGSAGNTNMQGGQPSGGAGQGGALAGGSIASGGAGGTIATAGAAGTTTAGAGGTIGGAGGTTDAGAGGAAAGAGGAAAGAGGSPIGFGIDDGLDGCPNLTQNPDDWNVTDDVDGSVASVVDNVMTLTDDNGSEAGRAYWNDVSPALMPGQSFSGELQYLLTGDPDDHADGLAFAWFPNGPVIAKDGVPAGGNLGLPVTAAGCAVIIDDHGKDSRPFPALGADCDKTNIGGQANKETWGFGPINSPTMFGSPATLRFQATLHATGTAMDLTIEALDGAALVRTQGTIDFGATAATWGLTAATGGSSQTTSITSIKVSIAGVCVVP